MADSNSTRTRQVAEDPTGPSLTLHIDDGPAAGTHTRIGPNDVILVGRAKDANLRIAADSALSRHHFGIEFDNGHFVLVDAGSANGTNVNGLRVDGTTTLANGDRIEAGQSAFVVRLVLPAPRSRTRPRQPAAPAQPAPEPGPMPIRRIRCNRCERVVTMERATVMVDDDGHVLSQPDSEDYVCRSCRRHLELAGPQFPGYVTLEQVGEGNMGAIYLVEDSEDGELFALKCLRPDGQLSDTDAARFLREAASLSALQHRNIVGFVDQGYLDGEFYFIMEYVEGVDLDLYRRQAGGRVPLERCVDLMGQILDGLDYAHRQGFVHRDVKPANILVGVVDGAMTPKLTDFGLAKRYQDAQLDPITRGHISFGTPDYMPPEQITAFKTIGPRSDLYSVGAALYHLLSGETLYQGFEGPDPIRTLLERDPPPLDQRAPWIPRPVVDVVQRAIARAPDDRWPTGAVFRDALIQALRLS